MTRQQSLFDREPPPWEIDDAETQLVATVVPAAGVEGEFDYLIPDDLTDQLQPGCRVDVPLGRGNRLVRGYCVGVSHGQVSRRLKSIHRVADHRSLLSPAMLRLTRWMADYYLCAWGTVLDAVLPAGVRGRAGVRNVTLLAVSETVTAGVEDLKLPKKQLQVVKTLIDSRQPLSSKQLAARVGCTQAPITALKKKGLLESVAADVQQFAPTDVAVSRQAPIELNSAQQLALQEILDAIRSRTHQTILMHGVTGSGKTEVYIQAIDEVVQSGRQAIVLVPEISLTPQTRERFRNRFDSVAVLHSHMSDAERHWHWQHIAAGQVQVVVGARSAIFAPTPHLGLIVLDEEHESSFKQSTAPRYHARDVARRRAQDESIPLVLGSATPSLESWQHTVDGTYKLIEMPGRVLDRPLPQVATIDLRSETRDRYSTGAISRPLVKQMEQVLAAGRQVILLLNRRGFSTHIQCPACGKVVQCPDCDIALTHHRQEELAICHYCDYRAPTPTDCPYCGFAGMRYGGLGTQRLEAELRARFPNETCLRMDTDSMRRRGSHEDALRRFRVGEVRILLGTQMIAKGLDFPNVTLVGVINADTALHLPDFRAAERTFQLVTQVAGRSGRGDQGGHVLVQTFTPDHPAIMAAVRHDYDAFATYELPTRELIGYPPFTAMIRLVVRGPVESAAQAFAQYIADRLREALRESSPPDRALPSGETPLDTMSPEIRVLGPAPAPIPKLRGQYRFQIQVQSRDGDRMRGIVRSVTERLKPPDQVQWIVDVDPIDML